MSYLHTDVSKYCYVTQFHLVSVICLHTVKLLNSSIWPINEILTGTTTPDQSGPGSNGNEWFHNPQSSRIIGASPSNGLHPGHSLWREGSYSPSQLGQPINGILTTTTSPDQISRTLVYLTPLQKWSLYILKPQPTWLFNVCFFAQFYHI